MKQNQTPSPAIVLSVEESLQEKSARAALGGGPARIATQHAAGKLTARERIALLLDAESFEETDQLATSPHLQNAPATDGVVTGFGTVDGRRVGVFSQDFTIRGGSLGTRHAQKICKVMDMCAQIGCPMIGILDSGGARIEEGIHALAGYGEIMKRNARYSGVFPQLSVVLGPCAGGAVYSPSLSDLIFTTKKISHLFITGPQVIQEVLGQEISKEELGGTQAHTQKTGLVHFALENERDCFLHVKRMLSYLPDNYKSLPVTVPFPASAEGFGGHAILHSGQAVEKLVPENQNKPYDMKKVIAALVDEQSFCEVQAEFAQNIVIGFARMDGAVVGMVANQTLVKAGTLDIDASCKAARFVNLCNSFNIPIVSLVDVPGFLPGVEQEHGGIIRHGAKLLYAYANATVPKITVVLRKAFGGAYIVMGSKHLGGDFNFAWPQAQLAVLGAPSAVTILHGRELAKLEEPKRAHVKAQREELYRTELLNPYVAAESGYIDAVIEPASTRKHLLSALAITKEKVEKLPGKRAGNIPL